jgi:hypothetical protein
LSLCLSVKHYAIKTYGEWRYSSTFLDLGSRWEWSASCPCHFTPQGNSPWYPLDRRLGEPQSRSGHCGEVEILQSGIKPRPSSPYPIAISTELSQLLHNISIIILNTNTNMININTYKNKSKAVTATYGRRNVFFININDIHKF